MKRLFLLLVVLLVALPLMTACWPQSEEPAPGFTPRPGPEVGRPAPGFSWKNPDGEIDELSNHRGQVVMIVFWLPQCGHCLNELPIVQGLYDEYEGLFVVSLTPDQGNSWAEVAQELDLTFTVVWDPKGQSVVGYRVRYYPTIFVVDREGIIRVRQEGALPKTELEELVTPLLEER